MLNALTVDVEDWYHTNGLNIPKNEWENLPSTVYPNTIKLLNIFDDFGVKATFFILGDVAKRYPFLVKEIVTRGHEIGSHGMNHQLVYTQTMEEFERDFLQSIDILEQLSGQKMRYFRAPSWSISQDRLEILLFLEQKGIICDSSLQPFKTPLSGIHDMPTHLFKPIINGYNLNLVEFPPTVMKWNKYVSFPFAGGFYLRLFPYVIISHLLKQCNLKSPGMVYVHPWELDPDIPRWKSNSIIHFIQYYRLSSTERKLKKLLYEFDFAPIGEVIKWHEMEHIKM